MAAPHFRLLLHGQDGSIPYLTPELMRLIFCPSSGVNEDTTSTSNDDGDDLQQSWKWHRKHLILGVAVMDTCVTAVYRDTKSGSSNEKKRKNDQKNVGVGDDRSAKKVKSEQSNNNDAPSSHTQKSDTTASAAETASTSGKEGTDSTKQPLKSSNDMGTKKPAGYTFLTPSQSAQICKEINSHINCCKVTTTADGTLSSTNYKQIHLRIPQYISTLIVPTFTLDSPDSKKSASDVSKSSTQDVHKNKHVPKQSSDNNQSKQNKNNKRRQKMLYQTVPRITCQ